MAERQAKRRAKLRQSSDYSAYLEKDKLRKRAQRAAQRSSISEKELEEHKLQEMMRVRNYRAKKKLQQSQNGSQPSTSKGTTYRTTQARGKAIKRAQASLPASPHKRLCVVERGGEKQICVVFNLCGLICGFISGPNLESTM